MSRSRRGGRRSITARTPTKVRCSAIKQRDVAIVGGGYSGASLAIALAARGVAVTLIERDAALMGRGVAYGTAAGHHLLNVRAGHMSASADRPEEFAEWLTAQGLGNADSFAPRPVYGRYLAERLAAAGRGVRRVVGEVVAIEQREGVRLLLADGSTIEADRAVLATGNLAPLDPPGIDPTLDGYRDDPWRDDPAAGLDDDATVLLIGTGLTAVDVALSLDESGFGGTIVMLSRRGLLPRAHAAPTSRPAPPDPPARGAALLAQVRARSAVEGWRGAVDALRPITQALWRNASPAERDRFLRHLRPWWDVHRHRIAPEIAERLVGMIGAGRLTVLAGKPIGTRPRPDRRIALAWRPRGAEQPEDMIVDRIVNCTGPQTDVARSADPLIRALLAAGTIRSGPLRLGIEVDDDLAVIDAAGRASDRLFAIGPVTRERFWEVVAVPDIRLQVEALAARLAQ